MESFRKNFPIFEDKIYLDYASVSPFSFLHRDSILETYKFQENFDCDFIEKIFFLRENLKELISRFINSESKENIAFIPNTSYGISLLASGLNLNKGTRVLIPDAEFPANVYPFLYLKKNGIEVDFVKPENGIISLNEIKKSIKKNTKIISISFVQFLNGYRAQLEEIGKFCKENEIIFIVDGIQGAGSCPLDVRKYEIDGLSTGGSKWLMWPQGTGFLYVSPNIFNKIKPPIIGWLSVKNPWDFLNYNMDLSNTSERFETGTINFMGFWCAMKILNFFNNFGIQNIFEKIIKLRNLFYEGIRDLKLETITPFENPSGIVTIKPKNPDELYKYLRDNKVIISKRLEYLRFSFHFINIEEDVLRTLELLKKFLKSGA